MSFSDMETSERIERIHPINAQYLLDSQPHRLYGDALGNTLEIMIHRFASTVEEALYGHGGIIALKYHDAMTEGERSFENGYILKRDGKVSGLHSSYGILPLGIEYDIFYMLLNPVEINKWNLLDKKAVEKERVGFGKFGVGIDISNEGSGLENSLLRMKNRYLDTLR